MSKLTPALGLHNFKATVSYRGTAYKGWQIQNGSNVQPTVQGALARALMQLKQEPKDLLSMQGAGRTDAGVHARGQVFHFYSRTQLPPTDRLNRAVNTFLPADIRVMTVERAPMDFHARYSAISKTYSFDIHSGAIANPLQLGLSQHVFQELDVNAMQQAAMLLRGKHDFTQFSSVPNATFPVSPIKTLTRAEVLEVPGGMKLVFAGSGFLYNQCRHMAGCLIRVGMGRLSLDTVQGLLQLGKQQGLNHRAWTLASACGLYLDEVEYPSYASHDEYMYPDAPHDAFGRLDFKKLPMEERSGVSEMMKIRKYSLQGALSEECDDGLD